MNDIITLRGIVGTPPDRRSTSTGLAITDFRLAAGQRRYDRPTGTWVDAETNWYTIAAFRDLAVNVASSIRKGDHVVVTGRLHVRQWEKDGRKGTSVDVDADAVGHDLRYCTTAAVRTDRAGSEFPRVASPDLASQSPARADRADPGEFDEVVEFDEADVADETTDSDAQGDGFLPSTTGGFATIDS